MRTAGPALFFTALLVCTACWADDTVSIGPSSTASCSPRGIWSLKHRDATVVQELGIAVWDDAGNFTGQKESPAPTIESRRQRRYAEGTLGKDLLRYRMFAAPCNKGIHFKWQQADTTTHTWAVVIKLPRTLFAGVDFILDGRHTHTFPAEQQKAPRLFTGNAQSLLTARAEGARLFLDCARRYGLVAQDARTWGDDSYHLLIYPRNGEVSILLSLTSLKAGPAILHSFENTPRIERFGKFELTMDLWAQFTNPYDERDISVTAEVTKPSGRSVKADGFIYREFLRSTVDGREAFEPAGDSSWKIRYTPDETGKHSYAVTVRTRRGSSAPLRRGRSPREWWCSGATRRALRRSSPPTWRGPNRMPGSSVRPCRSWTKSRTTRLRFRWSTLICA